MKIPTCRPAKPQPRSEKLACAIIALVGILVFACQLWRIHELWTPVGFVDTWPLYDRLMQWQQGRLDLAQYLLMPHGPHPHAIIYFLYLVDVTLGSGRQLVPHFATLLSIFGVIAVFAFLFLRIPSESAFTVRTCILLSGSLILLSGPSEATAIPFQAVVVVTRFIHFLLLAILVWCECFPNKRLHYTAIAVSCVAVSFYAAGGLFAFEILLLHLIFFRNWRPLLFSWLPLASYLCIMSRITPNAEMLKVASLVRGLNLATILEVARGTVGYYGSVLTAGWVGEVRPVMGLSELVLHACALIVLAVTLGWALWFLTITSLRVHRGDRLDAGDCAGLLMALLSLFVFASAVSAALLWVARAAILGAALGMPAYFAVLAANRYAAFAGVAFVVLLYIVSRLRWRRVSTFLSLVIFILAAATGLNSVFQPDRYIRRDRIESAATALLVGMSPASDEASAVWPGVARDWYWPSELPKTAAYLRAGGLSYAYRMPAVGQSVAWPSEKVNGYAIEPVPQSATLCRLTGSMASVEKTSLLAPQRFFPITTVRGEVVGFAVRKGAAVNGHLDCSATADHASLFLSDPD